MRQTDYLRDFVNSFSKFSYLPSAQAKQADIIQVLTEVLRSFRASYPNVQFKFCLRKKIPDFSFDLEQLRRVFINILANSVDALGKNLEFGSRIHVSCSRIFLSQGEYVRIVIADEGKGIPEHLRLRALEPYYSSKKEGTGLGLAIVNQIVIDHGGTLLLTPNKIRGTIVTIEIPIRNT